MSAADILRASALARDDFLRGAIGPGSKVKFIAHGETGLPHTVVTRDGDDCCLCDPRGRMLPNVPFELLVLVPGPPPNPAFRAVDELTGAPINAERVET